MNKRFEKSSSAVLGFTLTELLIALSILGIIATFTIPKVLTSAQTTQNKAKAKEVASLYSEAFAQYQLDGQLTASTRANEPLDLYMNYVKKDSTLTIDDWPGGVTTPVGCSANNCYLLHNGGVIRVTWCAIGSTTDNTYAMEIVFDPDGRYTARQDSVAFEIHPNGKFESRAYVPSGTILCGTTLSPDPANDPSWFSW